MGYIAMGLLLCAWYVSGGAADNLLIPAALFAIAGAISFHK
ncbi:MAG: hypothetical protein PHV18_11070 [Lachnospiraceae bacterium]|nr:hypothetical protein [Lachnospiraceae bacterium]